MRVSVTDESTVGTVDSRLTLGVGSVSCGVKFKAAQGQAVLVAVVGSIAAHDVEVIGGWHMPFVVEVGDAQDIGQQVRDA